MEEEAPPAAALVSLCRDCQQPLEDDGKVRKKKRARRCKRCNNASIVKRRKEDPVNLIQHRLYNMMSRNFPGAPAELHSRKITKRVLERWDSRSVISGTADFSKLCIACYRKLDEGVFPEENDLVVVTSDEAHELSRLDKDLRLAKFPIDVRFKINQVQ